MPIVGPPPPTTPPGTRRGGLEGIQTRIPRIYNILHLLFRFRLGIFFHVACAWKRMNSGILIHPSVLPGGWFLSRDEQHSCEIVCTCFNGIAIRKLTAHRGQDVDDIQWHWNKRELYRIANRDIDASPPTRGPLVGDTKSQ